MVAPLTVACTHCGAKLKLKSAAAVGKKVGCPKCQKPFVVAAPADEDDLFGDLPMEDFGGNENTEEEQEDEAPVRRKGAAKALVKARKGKKRGKNSGSEVGSLLLMILLIVAGVGAVGGVGYAVFNFLPRGGGGLAAYLPAETDTVIQVRPAELLAAPALAPIINDPNIKGRIDSVATVFGIPLNDIESITLGTIAPAAGTAPTGPSGPGGLPNFARFGGRVIAVIRTKNAVDFEQLNNSLPVKGTASQHNGKTYFASGQAGREMAFHQAGSKILLFGSVAEVKTAIDGKGAAPASDRFKFADAKQHFLIAHSPRNQDSMKTILSSTSTTPEASAIAFGLTAGSDITFVSEVDCLSSETAQSQRESLRRAIDKSAADLENQKSQLGFMAMAAPGLPKIMDQAAKALKESQVSASGREAKSVTVFPGSLVTEGKDLVGLAMRMGAMGGGMGSLGQPGRSTGTLPTNTSSSASPMLISTTPENPMPMANDSSVPGNVTPPSASATLNPSAAPGSSATPPTSAIAGPAPGSPQLSASPVAPGSATLPMKP